MPTVSTAPDSCILNCSPTQAPTVTQAPTTAQQPPTTGQNPPTTGAQSTPNRIEDRTVQCATTIQSAVGPKGLRYSVENLDPSLVEAAAADWRKGVPTAITSTSRGSDESVRIVGVSNPSMPLGEFHPPVNGQPAVIYINTYKVQSPSVLQTVIGHELGHALGAPDSAAPNTLMSGTALDPQPLDFALAGAGQRGCSGSGVQFYPSDEIMGNAFVKGSWEPIPLRRGIWIPAIQDGFGFDKAYHKHNLTNYNVILGVIEHSGSPGPGSNPELLKYSAPIYRLKCETSTRGKQCQPTNQMVVVEVIVSEESVESLEFPPGSGNRVAVGGVQGVVTAYCKGMDRCPDWVSAETGRY
ncbi:hypothetical protein ACXYTP_24020 [Tsukamurella ocularis]